MEKAKPLILPPEGTYAPSTAYLPAGADPVALAEQSYVSILLYPELWELTPGQVLWDNSIDLQNEDPLEYE